MQQRKDIYKRLIERFSGFSAEDKARAQAIQEGTAFKKGSGCPRSPSSPRQCDTGTACYTANAAVCGLQSLDCRISVAKARTVDPVVAMPDGTSKYISR